MSVFLEVNYDPEKKEDTIDNRSKRKMNTGTIIIGRNEGKSLRQVFESLSIKARTL